MKEVVQSGQQVCFPFHYGPEGETYSFYRIPKVLFTAEIFKGLSTDAKLLYGLLLDRMQLSWKNGWVDKEGRVFIYYQRQKIVESMGCGSKKAGLLLAELDDKKGIGLITRVHQGLGKPDRIYVRKCTVPGIRLKQAAAAESHSPDETAGQEGYCSPESSPEWSESFSSVGITTPPEVSKRPVRGSPDDSYVGVGNAVPGESKRSCNKTESNKTERSKTDLIISAGRNPDVFDAGSNGFDVCDGPVAEYAEYRSYFEEKCGLEYLRKEMPEQAEIIDGIRDLLTDACCSKKETMRISGDEKPSQVVKSRFMKLDYDHIRYVLNCFSANTTKVRNIKQYLLASLYNAPMTIGSYYAAEANNDLYGWDE